MARHKKKYNQDKEVPIFRPKLKLSAETKRGTAVVIFAALALVTFLSSIDLAGSFGRNLLEGLRWFFGFLAYFIPVLLLFVAILLARHKIDEDKKSKTEEEPSGFYWRVYLGAFLMTGSIAGIIHLFYLTTGETALNLASQGKGGGYLGAVFSGPAYKYLDFWASSAVLFALFVIGILIAFDAPLRKLWFKREAQGPSGHFVLEKPKELEVKINSPQASGFMTEKVAEANRKALQAEENTQVLKTKIMNAGADKKGIQLEMKTALDRKDWKLPPFDLLDDSQTEVDSGNIELNVAIIKKTLSDFGIEVEMGEVNVGPTVTQYTLRPAIGVKLSHIGALQNDLALALAAPSG